MEGKLVTKVIARLAEKDGLNSADIQRLQESVGFLEQVIDGLGFCLSKEGDLLSQWRGYAADATGVAIGFSRQYLDWFAENSRGPGTPGFNLMEVQYDPKAHEEEVTPTYRQIRQWIDAGAFKLPGFRTLLDMRTEEEIEQERKEIQKAHSSLSITVLSLFSKLFLLKSSAFREEQEWRLLSYFLSGHEMCSYRTLQDRVIPYRSYEFIQHELQPIAEIVLGPKHLTPTNVIEGFLKQCGYDSVRVRRSDATYR